MNEKITRQEAIAYDVHHIMQLKPQTVSRKELYCGFFLLLAKVLLLIDGAQCAAFLLSDTLGIAMDYDSLFIALGIAFIQCFGAVVFLSTHYPLWCSIRAQLKSRVYIEDTLKTLRILLMGLFFIVCFVCSVLLHDVAVSMIVTSIICMFLCSFLVGMETERAGIQIVFEALSHWSQNKRSPQHYDDRG